MKKEAIRATFDLEKKLKSQGYEIIIGIDEVGRGPLAGPVVASAAVYKYNFQSDENKDEKLLDLIRDSKTLSEKQRESLFDFIYDNFYVGIGICDHLTIDRVNILEASFLAMKSAVSQLKVRMKKQNKNYEKLENIKTVILLDGNKEIPNFSAEQIAIVGGDKTIKSISAASIIAKVTRDRMMIEAEKTYPGYGLAKHKGYGTSIHVKALDTLGPCEIHRRSFKPVRIRLGKMRKN